MNEPTIATYEGVKKVQLKTWLPKDLKDTWDLLLVDPLTGRAATAAWTRLIERLLREELAVKRGQLKEAGNGRQ